jgi:hypothetical protein
MAVNRAVFDAIKYAKDTNGRYLVLSRDLGGAGSIGMRANIDSLEVDGVTIMACRTLPNSDESADTSVYSKYRANYSTTTGILWCPMAVATLKLMDVKLEIERDIRRQEDFLVASMAVGHGTLRPECAVEFKTS